MTNTRKARTAHTDARRKVKCQLCDYCAVRWYGAKGILVDPCPLCGSRMTYSEYRKGDQPVTQETKP
jgi:hypothetical protein